MKTLLLLNLLVLCYASTILAQSTLPSVANLVVQISEQHDKVTVTYDLARKQGVSGYFVSVKFTLGGEIVNAQAVTGDVGPNITPGYGKRIIWEVLKDLSELSGKLEVEVVAKANPAECFPIKTIPVYAGLSGVGAAGIGLLLSGLSLENESKDIYDIYKNNPDPNGQAFTEKSREEFYQDANSKHKKATWLSLGGGGVLLGGGIIMVSRLIQINKYNKNCSKQKATGSTSFNQWRPLLRMDGQHRTAGLTYNF